MEVVKKSKEFTVLKKKNGRYAVKNSKGKFVNAADKVSILVAEGLIKLPTPKAVEEAPAEEAAE